MKKKSAAELWDKYQTNQISDEEKAIVESWYNTIDGPTPSHQQQMRAMKQVAGRLPLHQPGAAVIRLWSGIAAAIVLVIAAGLYYMHLKNPNTVNQNGQYTAHIKPGTNNAYLTLSNGKQIVLNNNATGILSKQPGIKITTTAGGQLIYTVKPQSIAPSDAYAADYNTLTTPRGGQYQVILPDGTHVWLNAASSLTYPTAFTGKERKVTLKGEGYFEVAKVTVKQGELTRRMPFIVKTDREEVQVLGTHFNVNAYADEDAEKTTLLEGSVKVTTGNAAVIIKPGEQALLSGSSLKVNQADVEQDVAWKNGIFSFKKVDIQTVMRQISRWYDIDVEYEGKIPDDVFVGKIRRSASITEVLKTFTLNNVHYRIEGRRIIIKR